MNAAEIERIGLELLLQSFDEHRARLDQVGGAPRVTDAVRRAIEAAIVRVSEEAKLQGATNDD